MFPLFKDDREQWYHQCHITDNPDSYKEMDPMVLYQMRSREALGDDAK